ncbi:nicotinamide mononucleotide transporter [Microvirga sp. STS02]|uniref:nicotinamide riboside transporter PnuC n=1 Tax=Hymenobacter negativus TaxID=2795026 RepID=UPI0018DD595C|nr:MULTISPECIES: nicotinamide riboside transporter PnuC [Bacteria]MBH8570713.1 nicotinamide mononucleotide transporter [Hymenobacter negativus]MBR7210450.1 nicotinamide mononucleotide transporter [Microvirga sp. STS02]
MFASLLLDIPTSFVQYWHATTALELVAVATGFACVWLAARESIWNFPVAIISCLLYVFVYYRARLYSDCYLQVLFIALSIYGWYEWLYGGRNATELGVTHATRREWLAGLAFAVAFTLGFGYYLHYNTDASLPHLDSFTTAGSIVAQYLLTRKRLENWLIWILVDLIYVPVLWYKDLYPTSLLYALYLGLAAYGYWQWRRELVHPTAVPSTPAAV